MPFTPVASELGQWETGEEGWEFHDKFGRVWSDVEGLNPGFEVTYVSPPGKPLGIGYEDADGKSFGTFENEDGYWVERYWAKDVQVGFYEIDGWVPYGPGTDYPDIEPMARISQAQKPEPPPMPPPDVPALELNDPKTYEDPDGNVHYMATDQYGRDWDWFRDAQGKEIVGYTDNTGLKHEVSESGGFWYDTFTDKNGNVHFGQFDEHGNVHDSWFEEQTNEHHEEVRVPAIEREEAHSSQEAEERARYEEATGSQDRQPSPPSGGTGGSEETSPATGQPEDQPADPGEEAAQAPGDPGEEGPKMRTQPPPPEPGQEDPQMRTQPEPGGDQEGQGPILDPNAQPMPMPSPEPPTGLVPNAPETTLNPGALMDRLLETLANNADVLEAVADDWGLPPVELKSAVEQIAGRPPGEDGELGEGGVPEPPADLDGDGRPDWDGDGDGIPNEYGDGPDLDGNGVPDEVGINPDNLRPGYPDKDGDGVPDPREIPDAQEGDPNQPGLSEAQEQALQEAGLTPSQIEWVEARIVEPGGTFTMEDPGFTEEQRDVIDGIREKHPGPEAEGQTPGEEGEGGEPMWTGPADLDPEEGGVPNPPAEPGEEGAPPPTGDDAWGNADVGPPFDDYMPFDPLSPDLAAMGELPSVEPEEMPGPVGDSPSVADGLDESRPENSMLSNLFDPSASGPTLDPDLLDPSASGPTLDSRLLDPASPGPSIDPALLDPLAPGPNLDPALLDPTAPGPTVDPALLDPSEPGDTIDPALLDPGAPGPTLDAEQIEQSSIAQPNGGVTEHAGTTDLSPTDTPTVTDPGSAGHDVHESEDLFEGV